MAEFPLKRGLDGLGQQPFPLGGAGLHSVRIDYFTRSEWIDVTWSDRSD